MIKQFYFIEKVERKPFGAQRDRCELKKYMSAEPRIYPKLAPFFKGV
jgi:hypothetical protein